MTYSICNLCNSQNIILFHLNTLNVFKLLVWEPIQLQTFPRLQLALSHYQLPMRIQADQDVWRKEPQYPLCCLVGAMWSKSTIILLFYAEKAIFTAHIVAVKHKHKRIIPHVSRYLSTIPHLLLCIPALKGHQYKRKNMSEKVRQFRQDFREKSPSLHSIVDALTFSRDSEFLGFEWIPPIMFQIRSIPVA